MPSFEQFISDTAKALADVFNGTADGGQRRWMDYLEIAKAGQFDLRALKGIFSRIDLNDEYKKLVGSATTKTKQVHVVKLANDFLAGLERDHAARTRSRIGTIMHGASRAQANSLPEGPLRRNTVDFLTRVADEDDATQTTSTEG